MFFHTYTVALSAWSYVGRVEEFAYPTPKQMLKNVALAKAVALCCSLVAAAKPP
jgi:hypothetical protein